MENLHFKLQELQKYRREREEMYFEDEKLLREVGKRCRQVLDFANEYLKGFYEYNSPFLFDSNARLDIKGLLDLLKEEVKHIGEVKHRVKSLNGAQVYHICPEILAMYDLYEDVDSMFKGRKPVPIGGILHATPKAKQTQPTADKAPNTPTLPASLTSHNAKILLERAVEAGYLTPQYQWIKQGHTRYQQAYLADRICNTLGIASKWKVFGELWDYKLLSQRLSDVTTGGYAVANRDEIDDLCQL